MTVAVVIGLLGPVAVGFGDAMATRPADLVTIPGLRARRLLASLVLAEGRARSADRLIEDVWGGQPPRSPTAALQTQISRLRPLLGTATIEGLANGYRLTGCRSDLEIVADIIDAGDAAALVSAQRWWRGIPGEDLGERTALVDGLASRAYRLDDSLDRLRISTALADGDFSSAVVLAEKRCAADPLDESAHVDLMRALAGAGRTADALAVFTRLRRALSAELGVDPGAQVSALNAELLRGDGESAPTPTPAPRRRGRRVSGLVVESTELLGRDKDVATIIDLVTRHRVVTVQGPGGVGKTRVANRVGFTMAEAGREVFYVPLAPVRDDDDVVSAIAAALGVGETDLSGSGRPRLAIGDLADRLVDAVRGRDAVIVLDNCEQVIQRCAQVVSDLLAADPDVAVLVTSRSPLLLAAERIYLLPVLAPGVDGAAVALFEARARAIRPDAQLPRSAVDDLCRHLDGLPLAIELAAVRIRTMTVGEIAARLTERFALLRGADRSAPDRHRTLRAVIDWSWELLDADAQSALRRLCRFPAGFSTDAAATVLGYGGVRLDDTLEALVNQSLLNVSEQAGRVRYRMLEMVREFGEDQLMAGGDGTDSVAVHTAMQVWAVSVATDAVRRYELDADTDLLAFLDVEVDNLVWVLRQATGVLEGEAGLGEADGALDCVVRVFPVLAGLWFVRGLHMEMMNWGARIIAALPKPPAHIDADLRQCWEAALLGSMVHQVIRQDTRSLATGRARLRTLRHVEATYEDPIEFLTACVLSTSVTAAVRQLLHAVSAADERVATCALAIRMNLRENVGDLDGALADAMEVHARAAAHNDTWLSAMVESNIGSNYGQRAQWDRAVEYYRRAAVALAELGAEEDELQTRCLLAASLVASGELDSAAAELTRLADGWTPADPDPQGNPEVLTMMMAAMAELELARGNRDAASALFWRGGNLLRRDHPLMTRDPGAVMLLSVVSIGLRRVGMNERAAEFLPLLAEGATLTFARTGWHDAPQAGTTALAAGYILTADEQTRREGARLMALSRKMNARADFSSTYILIHDMQQMSGLTNDEWCVATGSVADVTRRQAVDEVLTILASRRPDQK